MADPHDIKRQRENDDINNEMAGLDVGRQKRFRPDHLSPTKLEEKKRREDDARFVAIQTILAAQEQIGLVIGKLDDLQNKLDDAFATLEQDWDALEARTIHLDDGTAAYLLEDGSLRAVDGEVINHGFTENIPENAATWDEYEALRGRRTQLSGIQTETNTAREELNDGDISAKRLREIEKHIDEASQAIEAPDTKSMRSNTIDASRPASGDINFAPAP